MSCINITACNTSMKTVYKLKTIMSCPYWRIIKEPLIHLLTHLPSLLTIKISNSSRSRGSGSIVIVIEVAVDRQLLANPV